MYTPIMTSLLTTSAHPSLQYFSHVLHRVQPPHPHLHLCPCRHSQNTYQHLQLWGSPQTPFQILTTSPPLTPVKASFYPPLVPPPKPHDQAVLSMSPLEFDSSPMPSPTLQRRLSPHRVLSMTTLETPEVDKHLGRRKYWFLMWGCCIFVFFFPNMWPDLIDALIENWAERREAPELYWYRRQDKSRRRAFSLTMFLLTLLVRMPCFCLNLLRVFSLTACGDGTVFGNRPAINKTTIVGDAIFVIFPIIFLLYVP